MVFVPGVMPPTDDEQSGLDAISQIFASQPVAPEMGQAVNFLEGLLPQLEGMQGPAPLPVPGQVNPIAAMFSNFAAGLAQGFGVPGAVQMNEARLTRSQESRQEAERFNAMQQQNFEQDKQLARLKLMERIGEAKLEVAKEQNNIAEIEKQTKANFIVQGRIEKIRTARDKAKNDAITARQLEAIDRRAAQTRETNAARITLMQRYGDSPEGKVILHGLDAKARLLDAQYRNMLRANSDARDNYDPPVYSDEELENARLDAAAKMDALYLGGLSELEKRGIAGAPVSTTITTTKKSAADFFKK